MNRATIVFPTLTVTCAVMSVLCSDLQCCHHSDHDRHLPQAFLAPCLQAQRVLSCSPHMVDGKQVECKPCQAKGPDPPPRHAQRGRQMPQTMAGMFHVCMVPHALGSGPSKAELGGPPSGAGCGSCWVTIVWVGHKSGLDPSGPVTSVLALIPTTEGGAVQPGWRGVRTVECNQDSGPCG